MVHGRHSGVRALRALHALTRAAILLLLVVAGGAAAQDGSGVSLRGARQLRLSDGYQAEVVARGLRLPQDLAVDPPDGLWVLTRTPPGSDRGAGALVRVPLGVREPIDASQLPVVPIPFASATVPFEAGSLARHPGSGDLYVTEARGSHLYRVTRDGGVTVFAQGGNAFGDGRALIFDAQGRLLILDHAGRSVVADTTPDPLRELFGASEPYQGPVVHWLRVDETLPLPRNLEYTGVVFPPAALRRRRVVLPRYSSLAALPSGAVIASLSNGVIDQLRPDGTIARMAQLSGAGAVVAGGDVLYALDYLGGRIVRVRADGTVELFAEGLTRPAALAVLADGGVVVAEDTGRLLRIFGGPQVAR